MKKYASFYDLYLNSQLTPGEIIDRQPQLKAIWYDEPGRQYGRPSAYYYQLQEVNLAEAWEKVNAPVMAVHGEYDWIMSADDYRLLVNAINERHPGSAIRQLAARRPRVVESCSARESLPPRS